MKFRPYVNIWIDLWFLQVGTAIMREAFEMDGREYISLQFTLFHKWGGKFRLYYTGLQMMQNG